MRSSRSAGFCRSPRRPILPRLCFRPPLYRSASAGCRSRSSATIWMGGRLIRGATRRGVCRALNAFASGPPRPIPDLQISLRLPNFFCLNRRKASNALPPLLRPDRAVVTVGAQTTSLRIGPCFRTALKAGEASWPSPEVQVSLSFVEHRSTIGPIFAGPGHASFSWQYPNDSPPRIRRRGPDEVPKTQTKITGYSGESRRRT